MQLSQEAVPAKVLGLVAAFGQLSYPKVRTGARSSCLGVHLLAHAAG